MAVSKTEQIETSMQNAFKGINALKTNLKNRVAAINKERDDYVNGQTIGVVTEQYLRAHFREYDAYINAGHTREEFIRNELSLEQKLEIITEYSINSQILEGNNSVESKLNDIAARKKDGKAQYKEEAIELVGMYQKVLDENNARIALAKQDIERTKAQITEAEKQLQTIMGKDDETVALSGRLSGKFDKATAISNLTKHIADLKKKLSSREAELEKLNSIQIKMESEFKRRKVEIDTFLKAQNIYAFREAPVTPSIDDIESGDKESQDKSNGNTGATSKALNESQTAKSMFRDFKSASPERQRKLLMRNGNEDIIKMARHLGPIDRREFTTIMRQRMDELPNTSIEFKKSDGTTLVTLTKDELKNMRSMDADKLKKIREAIDTFNQNFQNRTIDEIDEFEDSLSYVRAGALIAETSGAFRGIRRFFDRFSAKGTSIYELSKSAGRYATLKEERTVKKEKMLDRLRVKVSRGKMDEYTHSSTKPLDRSGADDFNR